MRQSLERHELDYKQLLGLLVDKVPKGTITTYGELSHWAYGDSGRAPAIVAMLNGAVRSNGANAIYTNRVVSKTGKIVGVNGQLEQLKSEGIRMKGGNADLANCRVVRFG